MGYQRKQKRRRKRRRHDELLESAPIPVKDPVSDVQNALKNPLLMKNPDTILAMQSVLGNQAVQRAIQANNDAEKQRDEEKLKKKRDVRIERYKAMSLMLNAVFPRDQLIPMVDMFKEIGFDPNRERVMEILEGKFPNLLPTNEDSVFSLNKDACDETGQVYFFSEAVKNDLLRLQIILMLAIPENPDLQKIMNTPVVTATDITNNLLGVSGLDNSAELENITTQLNAHIDEYPSIARFLNHDQAKLLMDLEPESFRVMLEDILPEVEVNEIIQALKIFIKQLKNMVMNRHVLKRPDWEEAKRRGMFNKDSSSFDQVLLTLANTPH